MFPGNIIIDWYPFLWRESNFRRYTKANNKRVIRFHKNGLIIYKVTRRSLQHANPTGQFSHIANKLVPRFDIGRSPPPVISNPGDVSIGVTESQICFRGK